MYENGKAISYSVKEELVKANGYSTNAGSWKAVANGGSISIKNSYTDDTPGTGDNTKIKLWTSMMLISLMGLSGAAWFGTRRKKKEQ